MKISPLVLASSALVLAANAQDAVNHVVPSKDNSETNVVANGGLLKGALKNKATQESLEEVIKKKEKKTTTGAAEPEGANKQSANALGSSTATKPLTTVPKLPDEHFVQLAARLQAVQGQLDFLDIKANKAKTAIGGATVNEGLADHWKKAKESLQVFTHENTDPQILEALEGHVRMFEQILSSLTPILKNAVSGINRETNKVKASNGL